MTKYKGYRYPITIISHVVWCYYRFSMSLRDIEELMFARGIIISHEIYVPGLGNMGVYMPKELKSVKR